MKYFGIAAAALVMTISASASTLTADGVCGSFSGSGSLISGSWTCPTVSSLIGTGTLVSEYLVYSSDYSSGLTGTVVATTNFAFTATGITFTTDTVTSTGAGNSNGPVSSDGLTNNGQVAGPPVILSGFYNNITVPPGSNVSVAYTNSDTTGSSLTTSGYAELVVTYNTAVVSAPEPGSMMLLGSGLLAAGLIGRKKLAGRK